ncbi:oxidation resistance protein 1-like isoform X1 [Ursus maritimus]|uniref:Oxidation resistance protein 1-like isoform X1 n=1 Tax=Ursus maritimus TaxID=29073 RepID=A0A8M1FDS3_URSMA|nr:oxidation resistance protein 1-like isoform X1 [Ursus maritimus]XP_040481506.1 oxidation resistance protein 1-like isoform X1 [Ursus maritimus]XP_040481507.1 oxidation resistance protein 1-like isoform X1 [Ursus maritimus]
MSVSNLSWLKKKSQSVDITAPGFNPLAAAGKQTPQASKSRTPKTPIIEEEQNNAANAQKHPSQRSELKRFYTIDLLPGVLVPDEDVQVLFFKR